MFLKVERQKDFIVNWVHPSLFIAIIKEGRSKDYRIESGRKNIARAQSNTFVRSTSTPLSISLFTMLSKSPETWQDREDETRRWRWLRPSNMKITTEWGGDEKQSLLQNNSIEQFITRNKVVIVINTIHLVVSL